MHQKKTLLLSLALLSIIFLTIKCDDDGYVDEGGFEITGVVMDSVSQLPISSVIVGYTNYPDSIVFVGDSIDLGYTYLLSQTDDLGKFRISEIGAISMQDFQEMFAWKKEFKLWQYNNKPFPINEIKEQSFEVTIYLSKK
jgi:hypothetical protein